jgi:hypothetical protein
MELLTDEQQHLITECYNLDSGDSVRLSIIQESYVSSIDEYTRAVSDHGKHSRQAVVANNKLTTFTNLYNDFVAEMDKHYGNKK